MADKNETLLQVIQGLFLMYRVQRQTSLSEVTKIARVEPLVLISSECGQVEWLPDVLQTLLSLFTGYYLQAVALMSDINDVKVIKLLDRLNPDRDSTGFLISNEGYKEQLPLSAAAYQYVLPTPSEPRSYQAALEALTISCEADDGGKSDNKTQSKVVAEASNLAVGKLISVTLSQLDGKEKNSITVPVTVRLAPTLMSAGSILHLLAFKTENIGLNERYHAWRAGRLRFIKDLIFCQDLITAHKKALIEDTTGVLSEITRRSNNASKFGLLTGSPSLASASNLFVISEAIAKELELKLGGKLKNLNIRQRVFDGTAGMILCILDRDYERVTFYHRGIDASTELSVKSLKASSQTKGGADIMDIFKAYQIGNQVTL